MVQIVCIAIHTTRGVYGRHTNAMGPRAQDLVDYIVSGLSCAWCGAATGWSSPRGC